MNISVEKDCVEIICRQESSGWVYCNGESPPAKIWKDIYAIKDGQIVFDRKVKGRTIPQEFIPERLEWEE